MKTALLFLWVLSTDYSFASFPQMDNVEKLTSLLRNFAPGLSEQSLEKKNIQSFLKFMAVLTVRKDETFTSLQEKARKNIVKPKKKILHLYDSTIELKGIDPGLHENFIEFLMPIFINNQLSIESGITLSPCQKTADTNDFIHESSQSSDSDEDLLPGSRGTSGNVRSRVTNTQRNSHHWFCYARPGKPILYLYPQTTTRIDVDIRFQGRITTRYPDFSEGHTWRVTATPSGKLFMNNRMYYGLYWEGIFAEPVCVPNGHQVRGSETVEFLEQALYKLGLSDTEADEMIIYWLPYMENNPWNLIHFASDDYLDRAKLDISPEPDTVIRVMMYFMGLDDPINLPQQELPLKPPERKGFTVVEWGAVVVSPDEIMQPLKE